MQFVKSLYSFKTYYNIIIKWVFSKVWDGGRCKEIFNRPGVAGAVL